MIYRIKEAFWSWGDKFAITDPEERPVFQVAGAVFSWGNDLSFQDMTGNQLARIKQTLFSFKQTLFSFKQTLFSFKPRYEIQIDGAVFAEVIKEWSWWNQKFTLDVPGPALSTCTACTKKHRYL